jgi:hypothetical protein
MTLSISSSPTYWIDPYQSHYNQPTVTPVSRFNRIVDILYCTPGKSVARELQNESLTTKIVLEELTFDLGRRFRINWDFNSAILGKALSLITRQDEGEEYVGDFIDAVVDNLLGKDAFWKTLKECIDLNEDVVFRVLDIALDRRAIWNSSFLDLQELAAFQSNLHSNADEKLLKIIFTAIIYYLKEKDEDLAIRFIDHFPVFIQRDMKDEAGRTFLLRAIKEKCPKVADYLLKKNVNYFVKDDFNANIVDYIIAYEMFDILDRIGTVPVSEIQETKWLAHVWGLDGTIGLGELSSIYTGFIGKEGVYRISSMALNYLVLWKYYAEKNNKINADHPLNEMDVEQLKLPLLALRDKKDTLSLIKTNQRAIVKTLWNEHAAYVFFGKKQRVMKCNRGSECGVPGVRMYKMTKVVNLGFVHNQLKTSEKFMNSKDFDTCLGLVHLRDIIQKGQTIANCSYKSGQAAVKALFTDVALETFSERAFQKANFVYKDYTVFSRVSTLKKYLQRSKHPDLLLLKRIQAKASDLENRKDLWKGRSAEVNDILAQNNITL